jgi:hypothetical protein
VGGSFALGCAMPASDGENPSADRSAATVDQYRYNDETLVVSSVPDGDGRRLLDGPDNARLAELLGVPTSGVVVDPNDDHVFWIYQDDSERMTAVDTIKSHLVLEPGVLPKALVDQALLDKASGDVGSTLDTRALGSGCLTPQTALFENDKLGGAELVVRGATSDLWSLGFNDMASSLTFVSGITALYQDVNFGGHSITFVPNLSIRLSTCPVTQTFGEIDSLSAYVMSSTLWIFKTSWNDQASAATFSETQF